MIPIFALILALLFSGCGNSPHSPTIAATDSTTSFSGSAMTMEFKVIIGERLDDESAASIEQIILATFDDTDRIFNKWNENSEVSQLNSLSANTKVQLSRLLLRLFKETDAIVSLTEGRFDPTIEPLQRIWKQKLAKGTVPAREELHVLMPAVGWDKVHFDDGYFSKDHSGTMLDFGGIAKGLCIDLLIERIRAKGHNDVFVEWGGEIRANGMHPEGRPWTIFIARLNDDTPEHAVATLGLRDQAIATSGDYLQNWTVETLAFGKKEGRTTFFHIFDPAAAQPLAIRTGGVASASVVAPACAFADGLATAAMMFSNVKEAEAWADRIKQQYPDIQFWFVGRE